MPQGTLGKHWRVKDTSKMRHTAWNKNVPTREETKEKLRQSNLGKKLSEETKKKIGLASKGRIPWNRGKHHSSESKRKIKEKMKGKRCGKNNPMFGKFGKDSGHWKGGITLLNHQVRTCFQYRQWRSDVFSRDNYICQKCGAKGIYLIAHHKKEFAVILRENNIKTLDEALVCEELWNINNGETRCISCHPINGRPKIKLLYGTL